jgi:ribosomal-protein-alanine N-acetyltransferase
MFTHILHAGGRDAAAMARIHAAGFAHAWDENTLRLMMEKPHNLVLAAFSGPGDVLGFIVVRQAADEAEVITIATDPKLRRKGVGARLLTHAIELLQLRGIEQLFLEVASGNKAAIALYSKFGFVEVGRRQSYYQQGRKKPEDALIMRKQIDAG